MRNTIATRTACRVEVPATNTYFIWRADEEYGSYTIMELRRHWAKKNLLPTDYVRESHSHDWIDAESFLMPLINSDEYHMAVMDEAPVQEVMVATIGDKPGLHLNGELSWSLMTVMVGMCGLTATYFVDTHYLVTSALWVVCLILGVIGWRLHHSRSQWVLSLLFLVSISLGAWLTPTTPQISPTTTTVVREKAKPVEPGPGTLLGSSPVEPIQTWTSISTRPLGMTDLDNSKVESTSAADLPPMPELQLTGLTGIDR